MNLAEQTTTTATVMAIDTVTIMRWIVTALKDVVTLNLMDVGAIHLKGIIIISITKCDEP